MISFNRIVVISILLSMITGCSLIESNKQVPIVEVEKPVIIEQPPQLNTTNWLNYLTPLIDELLQTTNVADNNNLLIASIKNNSHSYISEPEINKTIVELLSQQTIFNLIDKMTISQEKQNLGIPYDDSTVSRDKMLVLAHNINANYILFTTVNQVPQEPDIKADITMKLMSVKTKKTIWQFSSNQIVSN